MLTAKSHEHYIFTAGVGGIGVGSNIVKKSLIENGENERIIEYPSKIIYDRQYSSISMADHSDFDWNKSSAVLQGIVRKPLYPQEISYA